MATAKRELTNPRVQGPRIINLRDNASSNDVADLEASVNPRGGSVNSAMKSVAQEIVARARAEQGLPPKIKDPAVIARVVALLQPVVDD